MKVTRFGQNDDEIAIPPYAFVTAENRSLLRLTVHLLSMVPAYVLSRISRRV